MFFRFFVVFICLHLSPGAKAEAWLPALAKSEVRAVWLWGDNAGSTSDEQQKSQYLLELVSDANRQREFFHRVLRLGINRVYLNVNLDTEGRFAFAGHLDALAGFIEKAHASRIQIYALFGHGSYANPENHHKINGAGGLIDAINAFNALHRSGFDGVQSDVEPYFDPATGAATDLLVGGPPFLQLTRGMADRLNRYQRPQGGPIPLEAAIPFWYAMAADDGSPPRVVQFEGKSDTLDRHILRIVSSVAVMAYRDRSDGPNGVIALATPTIHAAQELGKDVLIALETQKPNPKFGVTSHITLFEEGMTGAGRLSEEVSAHFATSPSFRGIAWHHYESLLSLDDGRPFDPSLLKQGVLWGGAVATGVRVWDVSGNYGHYGNQERSNQIESAQLDGHMLVDIVTRGGWGSGVSLTLSRPEKGEFFDAGKHAAVEIVYCANVRSILQLADARWHALDDSIPIGELSATGASIRRVRVPVGKMHPIWRVVVAEDPRYVFSGSDEYGWIDRTHIASLFLRFPSPQKGRFELIDMRFVGAEEALASPVPGDCKGMGGTSS